MIFYSVPASFLVVVPLIALSIGWWLDNHHP
jgi:hypothetical protein